MTLGDNILYLKKLLSGIGYSEQFEVETNESGGLQALFDITQARNIITYIDTW
jgi:hypothetical protein